MPGPARRNGFRSNWEGEYAEHLKQLRASKEIVSWAYEPIRLRIASNNFYTPDFLVCTDKEIQFHEVKACNVKLQCFDCGRLHISTGGQGFI